MPYTMTLTAQPDTASVEIDLGFTFVGDVGSSFIRRMIRIDANGSADVRHPDYGSVNWPRPLVLVDYEPALQGDVTYQAIDALGEVAIEATVSVDFPGRWLTVPVRPGRVHRPVMVLDETRRYASPVTLHAVAGSPYPVASTGPLRAASGAFRFLAESAEDAASLVDIYQTGDVVLLRVADQPALTTYHVPDPAGIDVQSTTDANGAGAYFYTVQVPYSTVRPPAGAILPEAWSYADLLASRLSYSSVLADFATYQDLLDNVVAP